LTDLLPTLLLLVLALRLFLGALLPLFALVLLLFLGALLLLFALVLLLFLGALLLLLFALVLLLFLGALWLLRLVLVLVLLLFFRLSLLFLGLSVLFLLLLLWVRGSNGSEKKHQNSRADKSNWFHECCLLYGDFMRPSLVMLGAVLRH
jgi:hypothetical protein